MSRVATNFTRSTHSTLRVSNVASAVTQKILWELCLQFGPVVRVHMVVRSDAPGAMDVVAAAGGGDDEDEVNIDEAEESDDTPSGPPHHSGLAYVEYDNAKSAVYGLRMLNGLVLSGETLRVELEEERDRRRASTGAGKLFIGSLPPYAEDALLREAFSPFGFLLQARVANQERGFGFVEYESTANGLAAIESLSGSCDAIRKGLRRSDLYTDEHKAAASTTSSSDGVRPYGSPPMFHAPIVVRFSDHAPLSARAAGDALRDRLRLGEKERRERQRWDSAISASRRLDAQEHDRRQREIYLQQQQQRVGGHQEFRGQQQQQQQQQWMMWEAQQRQQQQWQQWQQQQQQQQQWHEQHWQWQQQQQQDHQQQQQERQKQLPLAVEPPSMPPPPPPPPKPTETSAKPKPPSMPPPPAPL